MWRHACGCIRTSEKLKKILKTFPDPPPPTPTRDVSLAVYRHEYDGECMKSICQAGDMNQSAHSLMKSTNASPMLSSHTPTQEYENKSIVKKERQIESRKWKIVKELVELVQFSVTATALAIYYLIYCYMQLLYYTLRSIVYFHQADGAMKISIAIVTITSILVGLHIIAKIENLLGVAQLP